MHCGRELSPSWSVKNDLSRELSSCGDWSSGAGQQLGSDCDPCRGLGGGLEWGLRAVGGGQSVGRSMEGGMCPSEPYPPSPAPLGLLALTSHTAAWVSHQRPPCAGGSVPDPQAIRVCSQPHRMTLRAGGRKHALREPLAAPGNSIVCLCRLQWPPHVLLLCSHPLLHRIRTLSLRCPWVWRSI